MYSINGQQHFLLPSEDSGSPFVIFKVTFLFQFIPTYDLLKFKMFQCFHVLFFGFISFQCIYVLQVFLLAQSHANGYHA